MVAKKSKRKIDGTIRKLETLERYQRVKTKVRFDYGEKENEMAKLPLHIWFPYIARSMCQPHQHYAPTSENILSCQYSINLNDAYIDRYRKIKYKEKIK